MDMKEVVEGNRIIAEFMGFNKCIDPNHKDNPCYFVEGLGYVTEEEKYRGFKFHTSWDWLMPVVQKIQPIETEWQFKKPVMNALHDLDINILWRAAVQFIQWYNCKEPKEKE